MCPFEKTRLAAVLLTFGALTACASESGLEDALSGEHPAWGDSPALVEELRIGGLQGDEEYTFGSVSALAPTPDGHLNSTTGC